MGQVNRIDSYKLVVERANTLGARFTGDAALNGSQQEKGTAGRADAAGVLAGAAVPQRARGAVTAFDAFFPFADGLQVLIDTGVRAIVQPGGSIRDQEVIDAAQTAGVTMYLTGTRRLPHWSPTGPPTPPGARLLVLGTRQACQSEKGHGPVPHAPIGSCS